MDPFEPTLPLPTTPTYDLPTSTNVSIKIPDTRAEVEDARNLLRRPCIARTLLEVAGEIEQSIKDEKGIELGRFHVSCIRLYCKLWFEKHLAVSSLFMDENSNRPCATAYRKIEASMIASDIVASEALLNAANETVEFTMEETKQLHTICKDVPTYSTLRVTPQSTITRRKEPPVSKPTTGQNTITPSQRTGFFGMLEKAFPNSEAYDGHVLRQLFAVNQPTFEEDPQVPDKEHPNYGNPKLQLSQANLSRIFKEVERAITGGPENKPLVMDNGDLGVMQLLCKLITNSSEILIKEYLNQYLSLIKAADHPDHFPYLVYEIQKLASYFLYMGTRVVSTKEKWSFYLILGASKKSKIWDQLPDTSTFEDQYLFFKKSQQLQRRNQELHNKIDEYKCNFEKVKNQALELISASENKAKELVRLKDQADAEHASRIKDLLRTKEKLENDLARSTCDLLQSREMQNLREEKLKSELETKETRLKNTHSELEKASKQIENMKIAAKKKFMELQDEVGRKDEELKDVNQELEILKLDYEEVVKCCEKDKVVVEEKDKEIEVLRKERDGLRVSLSKAKAEIRQERAVENKQVTALKNGLEDRRRKLAESKASGVREQSTTNQLLEKNVQLMEENKRILKEGGVREVRIEELRDENLGLRMELEVLRKKVTSVLDLLHN